MDMPLNTLKRQLQQGVHQIGLWSSLASHITVEVIAGAGFDWLLLDTEHSPNELPMLHHQIAAMARHPRTSAVVRPAWNDTVVIKRVLELGVQTLLIPMVQNADEARRAVAATRYPPAGVRGLGTVTRANDYGRVTDYLAHANDEICVIVQLETRASLDRLEEIAAVDGVDGLFVGPSDLSADMGFLGRSNHAEVRAAIDTTIERIVATGKFAGILTPDEAYAKRCIELGARFVAVGSDSGLLARQSEALAARFKAAS